MTGPVENTTDKTRTKDERCSKSKERGEWKLDGEEVACLSSSKLRHVHAPLGRFKGPYHHGSWWLKDLYNSTRAPAQEAG